MKYLILLLLFININAFSQDGPMDTYEKQMFKEYNHHNVQELISYTFNNNMVDKSKFNIGDKKYKVRVKRTSSRAEYDETTVVEIKTRRARYYFTKRRRTFDFYSDRLSFNIHYNYIKREFTFISNRSQGFSHEFKVYGYVFAYEKGEMVKLEDWVIRDAYGRANSIRKPRK